MPSCDPRVRLKAARQARREKRDEDALAEYVWFFENALAQDESLYGVRLSYCLSEWKDLAKEFPPARAALEKERTTSLKLFVTSGSPERFHDYLEISKELGLKSEALAEYLRLHRDTPELASGPFRFMRDLLVEAEEWSVCSAHMADSQALCETYLKKFDGTLQVFRSEPGLFDRDDVQIKGWLVRDVGTLIRILQESGRSSEVPEIVAQVRSHLKGSGYEELASALDSAGRPHTEAAGNGAGDSGTHHE